MGKSGIFATFNTTIDTDKNNIFNMKRLFVTLAVLLLATMGTIMMARDVVYLKNGSIIKGSVIEVIPNGSVKIQTQDGSLFVFDMNEVDRIVNEEKAQNEEKTQNKEQEYNSEDYLKSGFRGFIDLGFHGGFGDAEDNLLLMPSFTAGYQVNRFFFIGAGCAPTLTLYDNEYYDEFETGFLLPIYGAIRFDFVNAKVSPFLDTRVGYSVTDDCRGLYAYLGVGCRIKKLSLAAGYTYQRKELSDYYYDEHLDFGFAGLRVGFEF